MNTVSDKNAIAWIVFFFGFIAMSPIITAFGVRNFHLKIIFLIILFIPLLKNKFLLKKWFIFISLIIMITNSITALYWNDLRFLASSLHFLFALFLMQYMNVNILNKVINLATIFLGIILILAIVGYIIAAMEIEPLFSFDMLGRPDKSYFFYTTLTNVYEHNYIRPAGIYDEPGALSLYVCTLAALRYLTNQNNKVTWILLLMGFITFSLAHLLYVFFHFLSEKFNLKNIFTFFIMTIITIFLVYSTGFNVTINEKLLNRLKITSESSQLIEGDNRTSKMINAINLVEKEPIIVLFGADPGCRFDYEQCERLFPLPMFDNPLSPMVHSGIFIEWPYYIVLIITLLSPIFGKRYFVIFAFGLLCLQRTSVTSTTMAVITCLILYCYFMKIKINSK